MMITADEITRSLTDWTAANSSYETERNYISLSRCALSVDELVQEWKGGFEDTLENRLRCYKGYQMEADLVRRIKSTFGDRVGPKFEITAHGGLVKGHPDFSFHSYPGDCKSVAMDDWLPMPGKLPRRVFWQMQGYMLYAGAEKALVVYESRESGFLRAYWVRAIPRIQDEITEKLFAVVERIRTS